MNWFKALESYFPAEEMKSEAQMLSLLEEKGEIYHKSVGEYHTMLYSEFSDFVYIDFLLVSDKARGKGIGRKVMEDLRLKNKMIIIEVEPADENNPDSSKRLRFYERLGFKLAESIDYMFQAFVINDEAKLDIMYWSDEDVSEDKVFDNMTKVYEEVHTHKVKELYNIEPKDASEVIKRKSVE